MLSDIFFKDCLTFKKIFFLGVKLRHSDMSNSLAFKNHHLHHYFQKLIKSSFFLRLMVLCSKLGAFAHASFIFKELKNKNHYHLFIKNHHCQDFQKSCLFFIFLFFYYYFFFIIIFNYGHSPMAHLSSKKKKKPPLFFRKIIIIY